LNLNSKFISALAFRWKKEKKIPWGAGRQLQAVERSPSEAADPAEHRGAEKLPNLKFQILKFSMILLDLERNFKYLFFSKTKSETLKENCTWYGCCACCASICPTVIGC
jgi:hypothetical protein